MKLISMADHNDFIFSITLEGEAYKFHFAWNPRSARWSLDIRDSLGNDIVRSIAIIPNFPLLNPYRRHTGLPPGELLAIVNTEGKETIGRDDFASGAASLIYMPKEELKNVMESGI